MTDAIWILLTLQAVLGFLDIVIHHELLERLAWRRQARQELALHGSRNALYVVFYLMLAWTTPNGWWAALLVGVLLVEAALTFWDWIVD